MNALRCLSKSAHKSQSTFTRQAMFFTPGIFLLMIGALIIFIPGLFRILLAGALIFFGVIFSYAAWKFIQLKRNFHQAVRTLEGQIIIQGMNVSERKRPPSDEIIIH